MYSWSNYSSEIWIYNDCNVFTLGDFSFFVIWEIVIRITDIFSSLCILIWWLYAVEYWWSTSNIWRTGIGWLSWCATGIRVHACYWFRCYGIFASKSTNLLHFLCFGWKSFGSDGLSISFALFMFAVVIEIKVLVMYFHCCGKTVMWWFGGLFHFSCWTCRLIASLILGLPALVRYLRATKLWACTYLV